AVRTALTVDMWDAVNGTWLEMRRFDPTRLDDDRLTAFLDWVQARTGLFHGVYASTLLRTDGFRFTRLGQFVERADNSARLLAARMPALPAAEAAPALDDAAALAVLRVVGARRAYRVFHKGRVAPRPVAELLLLRPEFPRSLVYCFEQITQQLSEIRGQDPRRSAEAKRQAHLMYAQLRFGRIDDVLAEDPGRRLRELIARIGRLAGEIAVGHCF
ncbi:MAG: alpha-E domain-containing protein, partial [Xanthomonadales bacterium]|nr:alpha-E domain-containing protein [Xanthomonadales bacterium]